MKRLFGRRFWLPSRQWTANLTDDVVAHYQVTVDCYEMTERQIDALFDRVAGAAHARDEQISVSGCPDCTGGHHHAAPEESR
jgi:hypothetical protein